jgi:hypothetical protein
MKKLAFNPKQHAWHFPNNIVNVFGPVKTNGLCGGMCLAAVNYYRYGMAIPHHRWEDLSQQPQENGNMIVDTLNPGKYYEILGYIYHSQIAIHASGATVNQFVWPWDDTEENHFNWSVNEYPKFKNAIDKGCFAIMGVRSPTKGELMGHEILVYGYDDDKCGLYFYDPNMPDYECSVHIENNKLCFEIHNEDGSLAGQLPNYRSYYLQLVLDPQIKTEYTTYDVFRNVPTNFSVKPTYNENIPLAQIFNTAIMHGQFSKKTLYHP